MITTRNNLQALRARLESSPEFFGVEDEVRSLIAEIEQLRAALLADPPQAEKEPCGHTVSDRDTDASVECSLPVGHAGGHDYSNPPSSLVTPGAENEWEVIEREEGKPWTDESVVYRDVHVRERQSASRSLLTPASGAAEKVIFSTRTVDSDALPAPSGAPSDPSNHHNALTCPYCNPKGLVFSAKDGAE